MTEVHRASDESATLREAHARVGNVLNDKWKLERLLGVGGMGAVYSGLHRNGARAAVKVLHHYLAKLEDVRSRFLREGYAANRVEHPGVVKVLDDDIVAGGPDQGTAYLVMELLVGESLEGRSRRGLAVSERDFLVVAAAVLEVLEVAHRSGVVHRDIKPDNIFITRGGAGSDRIKVLDFGLARLLEGSSKTVHGIALGTPPFMSPEQAAGRNDEIDGRTDLFALAACGFRLITGRRIHEGSTSVELVLKMVKLPAPRIRTVAPQVSAALAGVLDRALEFSREDRYESAAAMRADVESALARVDVGPQLGRSLDAAPRDASIELSASDLQAMSSVELRGLEARSVELSASDLEALSSVELRDLDGAKTQELPASAPPAPSPAKPSGTVELLQVTQPMPASKPAATPSTPPTPPTPSTPAAQASAAAVPWHRSPRNRALLGVAVFVAATAAFVGGWLALSASASAPSRSSAAGPSATTHLSPARPPTKPGKRPKR